MTFSTESVQINPVHKYAIDVCLGAEVAGPHVRASCRRHLRDLLRVDIYFDADEAQFALDFFPGVLRLSEGQFEGKPLRLEPSQAFIVGSLFGWKRLDGTRRFRRAYIEQGKGNGKSPMVGGIGLFGLVADGEAGAQIYAVAAKRDQAMILFSDAVKMVEQSPSLRKRIKMSGKNPVWNMAHLKSGSFFRPISRDSGKSGSGPRPHFALADELHEHPDRNAVELLERGFKFRLQPMLVMITNSGSDRNSFCWEEHEHAVAVAHMDVEDDTAFSYVCALDQGDDPLSDPTCWKKANPLLGVTITEQYLRDVVAQAKAIPGKLNGIMRLHFCVWTDAETAWIARDAWEACEDVEMKLEDFEGVPFFGGLDLSSTLDLTAAAFVFPDGFTEPDEDGKTLSKFALFCRGYTPGDTLAERALQDKAPYEVWAEQGHLIPTPGPKVRLEYVAEDVSAMAGRHGCEVVAYDRYLIKSYEEKAAEAGADDVPYTEHPQGINQRKDCDLWMPQSIDEFETLILEKRLRIQVNPALRSAVAGATFYTSPAGLRRFEKQRAKTRIDMCVASAMAVGTAVLNVVEDTGPASPWDDPNYSLMD